MALADLTGTTWTLNDSLTSYAGGSYSIKTYSVNIETSEPIPSVWDNTVTSSTFTSVSMGYNSGAEHNQVDLSDGSNYSFYLATGHDTKTLPDIWELFWLSGTFTITGGIDATNSALIAWVEDNCTSATPPTPDVVVTYEGSNIVELSEAGTKTLKTGGKYLEGDLVLTYSGGSGGSIIDKTVTENGTYSAADDGAVGYGSVTVDVAGNDPYPVRNDGKTHLWVVVDDMARPDVTIAVSCASVEKLVLDWGDGVVDTNSVTDMTSYTHNYASVGIKEVTISGLKAGTSWPHFNKVSSSLSIMGDPNDLVNARRLVAAELYNYTATQVAPRAYAFRNCTNLEKVTLAFRTSTGFSLAKHSLTNSDIPDKNWAMPKLKTFAALNNTTGCTVQANVFENCPALEDIDLAPRAANSAATSSLFRNCMSLKSVPTFQTTAIGESYCENCYSLETATIHANVTTIGASAFANCYSMTSITFLPTTPPTVADATAWTNLPTTCAIHVPSGTLADYQAAANYPDPATYTYVEE